MKYAPLAFAALLATALPTLASAQRVTADIRIGSGPVVGRVIVGDPDRWHSRGIGEVDSYHYRRPAYREVAVYRIHRADGRWRHRGYRAVSVWYDIDRDRYYDHGDRYRNGLREVVIYERDGRYYDDDFDRHGGPGYDRRHDRGADYEDYHDHDRD
jgi:hypothetical protein